MTNPTIDRLRIHRPWEDCLGMALGALTVFTPWAMGADELPIAVNGLLAGLLIYSVSALELRSAEIWEDGLNVGLGLWLFSAPWTFGYDGGALAATHHALGLSVTALAAFELWQDMKPFGAAVR